MTDLVHSEVWKKKLHSLGYKLNPINPYKIDGGCIICGNYDRVFPLGGQIIMCTKCHEKAITAKQAYGTPLRSDKMISTNIFGNMKCNVCDRPLYAGMTYYLVTDGMICTKCSWHKLGKQGGRMKV